VCVEKLDDQAVERFWSFQVCQVTGARKHTMSSIGNTAGHESVHRDAGLVVLTHDEQNWDV
jgi:hypothetical protein